MNDSLLLSRMARRLAATQCWDLPLDCRGLPKLSAGRWPPLCASWNGRASKMSDCINLRERFGDQYRIGWDECRQGLERDPWLMLIPCKFGHIFPHGNNELAASIDGHPIVSNRIRRLFCCRIHQDGDFGEVTAVFNAADLPTVAKVIRPRRRPRLSDRQRAAMAERMRAVRRLHPEPQRNREFTDHTRDSSTLGDI